MSDARQRTKSVLCGAAPSEDGPGLLHGGQLVPVVARPRPTPTRCAPRAPGSGSPRLAPGRTAPGWPRAAPPGRRRRSWWAGSRWRSPGGPRRARRGSGTGSTRRRSRSSTVFQCSSGWAPKASSRASMHAHAVLGPGCGIGEARSSAISGTPRRRTRVGPELVALQQHQADEAVVARCGRCRRPGWGTACGRPGGSWRSRTASRRRPAARSATWRWPAGTRRPRWSRRCCRA